MKIPKYSNNTGLPSSTSILSSGDDSCDRYYTDEGKARGTLVHYLCELYLEGHFIVETSIDNDILPYYLSFKAWSELMIKDVILIEKRLIDKKGLFCGQIDFIARLNGDKFDTLVDIKTSMAKNEKAWGLQIASYKYLAEENGIKIGRAGSLRVRRNGGLAVFDKIRNYEDNLKIFKNKLISYYKENIEMGVINNE